MASGTSRRSGAGTGFSASGFTWRASPGGAVGCPQRPSLRVPTARRDGPLRGAGRAVCVGDEARNYLSAGTTMFLPVTVNVAVVPSGALAVNVMVASRFTPSWTAEL